MVKLSNGSGQEAFKQTWLFMVALVVPADVHATSEHQYYNLFLPNFTAASRERRRDYYHRAHTRTVSKKASSEKHRVSLPSSESSHMNCMLFSQLINPFGPVELSLGRQSKTYPVISIRTFFQTPTPSDHVPGAITKSYNLGSHH